MRATVLSIREPRLGWRARDYASWRAIFGLYLTVHFGQLIAWAPEIWSSSGVLANGADSPLLMPFNLFAIADAPLFVTAVVTLATGLSVMLAIGWYDRFAAIALWYVLASMLGRNPLIANPGLPFVGWLLLAHALVPRVPRLDLALTGNTPGNDEWRFPPFLWTAAWIVMAVGYSYSGYTKLVSPSWVDGTAFRHLLENPLARDAAWRGFALSLPGPLFAAATWGALALELAFAPLALLRKVRPWLWLAMVGMHAALVLLVDFADLTLGMVMIHLFTFNPAWIRRQPRSLAGRISRHANANLDAIHARDVIALHRVVARNMVACVAAGGDAHRGHWRRFRRAYHRSRASRSTRCSIAETVWGRSMA